MGVTATGSSSAAKPKGAAANGCITSNISAVGTGRISDLRVEGRAGCAVSRLQGHTAGAPVPPPHMHRHVHGMHNPHSYIDHVCILLNSWHR